MSMPTIGADRSAARRARRGPKAAPQEITYEQYLRLPETMKRYEIIDGEMMMSPAPSMQHQISLADLNDNVRRFVREHKVGFVLFAPFDIIIRKEPKLRTRQADLAFWSVERIGGRSKKALVVATDNGVAPDLAVELLSPDESKRRLSSKMSDYAEIGIAEVWLIGDQMETIEVMTLAEGTYRRAGLYGSGDMMASVVLPGFTLAIDELFADS